MQRRLLVLVIVACVLATPGAVSGWAIQGADEPDTPEDRAGHQWSGPPETPGERRVYLNAVVLQPFANAGGVNTQAHPGSRLAPVGAIEVHAYLGVWEDCNGDGYVGAALSAMWRYPAATAGAADARCPPGTPHNDGRWLTEFLWISNRNGAAVGGIEDPGANVWGDFGRPTDVPNLACRTHPLPRGATGSTGGLLGWADCHAGFRVGTTVNEVDGSGSLGLRFEDPRHPEQGCGSALHQQMPHGATEKCPGWGTAPWERAPHDPAFTTWDCSSAPTDVRDPTAPPGDHGLIHDGKNMLSREDGMMLQVYRPAPEVRNPQGSYYQGLTTAYSRYNCQGDLLVGTHSARNSLEGPYGQFAATEGKRSTDIPMVWSSTGYGQNRHVGENGQLARPLASSCATMTPRPPPEACQDNLAPLRPHMGTVDDGWGLRAPGEAQGGGWRATLPQRAPFYYGHTVRSDGAPAGPVWISVYATLGTTLATATLPAPSPGTYGAEACGTATSGVHAGWDCDADNWWRPDLGGAAAPVGVVPAKARMSYHLRDVDCLDGSLAPSVRLSLMEESDACPAR